jgi:uncharacterized membrane protein YbhN (UPF0104 family)
MEEDKSRRRIWIPILILVLVVILLVYVIDLDDLIDALGQLKFEPLALGALSMGAGLMFISVRWHYLLANRVSFLTTFHTDAISYMIRMFTPVFVPVLRVATISMVTKLTTSQMTPPIMAERLMEFIMRLVALVLASFLISTSRVASTWVILWIVLLTALIVGLVRFSNNVDAYLPRLSSWLARLPRIDEERLEAPLTHLGEGVSSVGTTRRLDRRSCWMRWISE